MARRPTSAGGGTKPRIRVPAGGKAWTRDSYQNFAASVGVGAANLSSGGTYGFNPITRNHTQLEYMYRGSWLVKVIVDAPAEDMTRERINIESDMAPDIMDRLDDYMEDLLLWQRLTETLKWSRLFGGCIAVIMIDGQRTDTPLDIKTVGKGQFKGLLVLDRWMIWPHLEDPVKEFGKDYGYPKYYEVVSDARTVPHMKVHYTRCIRFDGVELPYWQRMAENYWGLSVLEPCFDRLLAFDSATAGTAQLVYRAHLRVLKIEKLRELIAFGGEAYSAVTQQIQNMRLMQANEGITLLDSTDEFETQSYAFGGLSDVLIQMAQQLSGAAQIPLVRLFGQSPAGLNATGDSDIRNYYDFLNSAQETRLRRPVRLLLDLSYRSLTGEGLPDGFNFEFAPLWQLADTEKSGIAAQLTQAVIAAQAAGIVSSGSALKELRQSSKITGIWSNITDEEIADAVAAPPLATEMGGGAEAPMAGGPHEGAGGPEGLPEPPKPHQPSLAPHPSGLNTREDLDSHFSNLRMPRTREEVGKRYAHLVGDSLPEGFKMSVGADEESQACWLIENRDTGNWHAQVQYSARDEAVQAFKTEFGEDSVGPIKRMSFADFSRTIAELNGPPPEKSNGSAPLP